MRMIALLALVACGTSKVESPPTTPAPEVAAAPSAAEPSGAPAAPVALFGQRVDDLVVPDFAALSHDGTPRSRDDLLGHPTVVWFFPVAGTPG